MTEVEIRPMAIADLAYLVEIDHSYHTDFVWQMDLQAQESEVNLGFREMRLPRSMRVEYPHLAEQIADDWKERTGVLVAVEDEEAIAYISLLAGYPAGLLTVTDLVVRRRDRRKGIGTALLRAAQTWATEQGLDRLVLEMQSKNYPAIQLAHKLGYEFCGYNDRHYSNQDIALFFAKRV